MYFARLTLALAASALPALASAQQLTGAGSTLAQPVYQKWADASAAATGITLNYQGVGSGAGIKLITQRTVDFGASDAPLSPAELQKARLAQFPTVIGAVDAVVNLPGIASDRLRLTGPVLADIYLGKVTTWNAPEIAHLNPGLKLPALPIAPVYRADGSGTTYVFTGYLAKVSPDFQSRVGVAKQVSWPAGQGAKGSAGVAGAVRNTPGGLGYVESAYATLNHLTTVALRNHAGKFLAPTPAAFAAAAANANWAAARDFAVDMNDQPGAGSWPIVSATFVMLPTAAPRDPAAQQAVLKFFRWAFAQGDATAAGLQFIPLPAAVKQHVEQSWSALGAH